MCLYLGNVWSDQLLNNSHLVDHVPGGLEQTFDEFSILRIRQSIRAPFGLNFSVANNGTRLGEDTLDQFGCNFESLSSILNTLGANLVDSSLVFRSQLEGIVTSIELGLTRLELSGPTTKVLSSIVLSQSNLSQAKKS